MDKHLKVFVSEYSVKKALYHVLFLSDSNAWTIPFLQP